MDAVNHAYFQHFLQGVHKPYDEDRFRIKEEPLAVRISTCQFGTPNDFKGYHACVEVEILAMRRDAHKKVVYLVRPTNGLKLLGAAHVPSKALGRVITLEQAKLYCANYLSFTDDPAAPSHLKREADVRRQLRF